MLEEAKVAVGELEKSSAGVANDGINPVSEASDKVSVEDHGEDLSVASQTVSGSADQRRERFSSETAAQGIDVSVGSADSASSTGSTAKAGVAGKKYWAGISGTEWCDGVTRRFYQEGIYDFTTEKGAIGVPLDPENRWIELRDQIFVAAPEMMDLEAKYYERVREVASRTVEEKYVKKMSFLKESDETRPYSDQLSFPALEKANEKYSKIPEKEEGRKSNAGRKPLPFQRALGVLIAQSALNCSDRHMTTMMIEDPYIQLFCGYTTFSKENCISHSKISELKEVFDAEFLMEINEVLLGMKIQDIHLEAKKKGKKTVKETQKANKAEASSQSDDTTVKKETKLEDAGTAPAEEVSPQSDRAVAEDAEPQSAGTAANEEVKPESASKAAAEEAKLEGVRTAQAEEVSLQDDHAAMQDAEPQSAEATAKAEVNPKPEDANTAAKTEAGDAAGQGQAADNADTKSSADKGTADAGGKEVKTESKSGSSSDGHAEAEPPKNAGSLTLDATCDPANAKFPQDFDLLNDARKETDKIIDNICDETGAQRPRTDRKTIQNDVKDLSKKKKRSEEEISKMVKRLLKSLEHNFQCISDLCEQTGHELTVDETYALELVKTIYGQQKYMYENHVRTVANRIVSFSMPQIAVIARGKVASPYEFGLKSEISIDEHGFARLERYAFGAFNEGSYLQDSVESFKARLGYYPAVVRVDQIYRTKANIAFCKERGIRLSGPALGRKPQDVEKRMEQIRIERMDMVDRIEVERHFSRQKNCYGLDCVMERTPERMAHAVAMGVLVDNLLPVGF